MNLLNPYVIIGSLGALLVSFLGGAALGWHEKSIRVPALLEAQKTEDAKECKKKQAKTKEAQSALQKKYDAIAAKLAATQLQPATCVVVTRPSDLPSGGAEHAGQNGSGISSDWLRGYAAEAERYRSERIVCEDFLNSERQ